MQSTSGRAVVHGLGVLVVKAVEVALAAQARHRSSVRLKVRTSSVTLVDDVVTHSGRPVEARKAAGGVSEEDADDTAPQQGCPGTVSVSRVNSAVHIELARCEPTATSS
ncbi:hypothetical protein HK405_014036 [Cladochytrium tenue]|nr:hypothetical protein HK405_014036 [Cladochytrium tenue]